MRKEKIIFSKFVLMCYLLITVPAVETTIVDYIENRPIKETQETEYITEESADIELTAGFSYEVSHLDLESIDIFTSEVETVQEMYCEKIEEESSIEDECILVSSTGYYDVCGYGYGAMGPNYPLIAGRTVAGRVCWLGKEVEIYSVNDDGTVGYLIGTYQFTDTGYGTSTGYGESSILPGRSVGTIECGQCIDIYFNTYQECVNWGRRNVYIRILTEYNE